MLSGVTSILLAGLCAQVLVGFPLILPFKTVHPPSIILLKRLSYGPGMYVAGTLGATVVMLFFSSLLEAYHLTPAESETSVESMMASVQQGRSLIVCIVCFANMILGVLLPRLAHEVAFHDKLRLSHDALKRQAAGLSAEYTRVSATIDASDKDGKGESVTLLKSQVERLMEVQQRSAADLKKANEENKVLQSSLKSVKLQAKNMEKSYDELMADSMELRKELDLVSPQNSSKKGD